MTHINPCCHKKLAIRLPGIFSVTLFLLQILFLTVGRASGLEYSYNCIFYWVNALILLSATLCLIIWKKKAYAVLGLVLICTDIVAMFYFCGKITETPSTSPNGKYTLISKRDCGTGKTTLYLRIFFLFAQSEKQLTYPANTPMKIQWASSDICTVTYTDAGDGMLRQDAICFDTSHMNHAYFDLRSALLGTWETADHKAVLTEDSYGIMITTNGKSQYYLRENCKAGAYLLTLCKDGTPVWNVTVADGHDDFATVKHIHLCAVSTNQGNTLDLIFTPDTYISATDSVYDMATDVTSDSVKKEAKGRAIADKMACVLRKSPQLLNFRDSLSGVRVTTDSTDLFWIGRLADEQICKEFVLRGIESYVQIEKMQLLAGDKNEFLVSMEVKECYTGSDTVGLGRQYRIKKGNGVYLAIRVPEDMDGSVGLRKLSIPQEIITDSNPKYQYSAF